MNLVCGFVEPQTFSLSRKRAASVAMECETETTMEVENVNPPRTARERMLIAEMEQYLEKGESIQVEIGELEHFLLGPEDPGISIRSFAEKRMGRRRLSLLRAAQRTSRQRSRSRR